ncbi:DnaB-like helicase C-terminal domain-containing protein [Mesoterricola sediminis]|uniref:DNA 5'-3' helicase n=1 Tax=Mesoterricola sediminis TaxID=2927980 RepID=A0AA48KD79_9BACT|nr:DnaB-like helicase C-terminal domain-containing protein [Mesoterricola sediminis]BDU77989.1 replicative DNA helicase [Mesoterricola sediminis]
MTKKPPPQDVGAERALLTTLCAPGAEEAAARLVPGLQREDFMVPAHQVILEALRALLKTGIEISLVSILHELEAHGQANRVGGVAGLADILGAEEVARPEVLVDILQAHRRRREVMRWAHQAYLRAEDTTDDPEGILHDTQAEMARISRDGRRDEGESWEEILVQMAAHQPFRRPGPERGGWWGIPSLDETCPIPAGEFTTLGARPGIGKTALLTQIAIESARRGIKVLVLTLELPKLTMRARLASYLAHISVTALKRGDYQSSHIDAVGLQANVLEMGRTHALPAGIPWAKIEALIRFEQARHGIELVLLDQFDKIGRPPVGRGSSEAYAFGAVSTSILEVSKDLGIGFVLLCQLKGDAQDREPTLSDHADSDRPAKDAGVILHLWRAKNGEVKAKLHKHRDGSYVGKVFSLDFDGRTQHFRDLVQESSLTSQPAQPRLYKPEDMPL